MSFGSQSRRPCERSSVNYSSTFLLVLVYHLQVITLRSYPCQLSLTAFICFWGMLEGAILALVMERGNSGVWSIHFDIKLLAGFYGAILSSAAYYVMGMVVKKKGPVFYSAFNPLATVMVAVLGSFLLAEQLYLGSLIAQVPVRRQTYETFEEC